jgi:hypothetical protein
MKKHLEEIIDGHPALAPELFVRAAVAAFLRHGSLPRPRYSVQVRNCPSGESRDEIEVDCGDAEILKQNDAFSRTLQEEDITEYAAVVLAMMCVSAYTELQVVEVTQRGERADYWLGRIPGEKDRLLEVSGIANGSPAVVAQRERDKISQVRSNERYRRPFFVSISEFRNGFSIFSQK